MIAGMYRISGFDLSPSQLNTQVVSTPISLSDVSLGHLQAKPSLPNVIPDRLRLRGNANHPDRDCRAAAAQAALGGRVH